MDFKKIYEAKYEVEGLELDDSHEFSVEKQNFLDLLKRARICLGEAAEYGKAISYLQERSPVDHSDGYVGQDGEWIETPFTDEEIELLKPYNDRVTAHHNKRKEQDIDNLDNEIYKLMDAIEKISEKVEKVED